MITPELKDQILKELLETANGMPIEINPKALAAHFDITVTDLNSILKQFEDLKLCELSSKVGNRINTVVTVYAHDFLIRGGFFAAEELFTQQIEKLLLEIESLKPSMLDKVEAITTIAANIRGFFKLI